MPDRPHSIPNLETASYSEALRRELYDIAVQIIFYDGSPIPDYTPDQCELVVFHIWGRWFATSRDWSPSPMRRCRYRSPVSGRWSASRTTPIPRTAPRGLAMGWDHTAREKRLAPIGEYQPTVYRVTVHDTFEQ